jgi:SAM-dependent methyltransferase
MGKASAMSSESGRPKPGDLLQTWDEYYRQNTGETVLKDRNFFQLEIEAIRDAVFEQAPNGLIRILELGSGTGFLAQFLIDALIERGRSDCEYVGVDFSAEAVAKARSREIPSAEFVQQDFQSFFDEKDRRFDVVVAQRSIMALVDPLQQRRLLGSIKDCLGECGVAILSEGTQAGFEALNALRRSTGQDELDHIWHCLYLDEEMVREVFEEVGIQDYSSTYWLITRVIYPFGRNPEHNTPIHDLAAELPQFGNFGLVKLIIAR